MRRLGWSGHTKIIFIFEKIKQIKVNYIIWNQDIFSNQRAPWDESFFWLVLGSKVDQKLVTRIHVIVIVKIFLK